MTIADLTAFEITTLIFAALALIFTIWQFATQRRHNKLSVEPHLVVEGSWGNGNRRAYLKNVGLGPARILNYKFLHNDKEVPLEITDQLEHFAEEFIGLGFYSTGHAIEKGTVLEPGKSISLLVLSWHDDHDHIGAKQSVVRTLENLYLEVSYESFYKDRLKLESRALVGPNDYSLW